MTRQDKESVVQLNAWLARTLGHRYPEGELRATGGVFDAAGKLIREPTPSGAGRQILDRVERPNYRNVSVPALAVFQPMELWSLYPNAAAFTAEDRALAEHQAQAAKVWRQESIAQFRAEAPRGGTVVLESGGHHVFLTNQSEVVRLVRGFLSEVLPR